ncbi:MAG: hypothetical protein ACTHM2_12410 [Afipia sp.]|jgi:hypothetical protein
MRTVKRSLLAAAEDVRGALALTSGVKPGRKVNAAARRAAIAHTESALTMTIPLFCAFRLPCEEDAEPPEKVHRGI